MSNSTLPSIKDHYNVAREIAGRFTLQPATSALTAQIVAALQDACIMGFEAAHHSDHPGATPRETA